MKRLKTLYRGSQALLLAALAWSGVLGTHTGRADSAEELAWQEARARGDAAAFEGFLERYPAGEYASEAYHCLVVLSLNLSEPSCTVEPAAGPARGSVTGTENPSLDVY
jgi:hypothetical protein